MKAKFYNRILSQKEITKIYNNGIPFSGEDNYSFVDWIPIDGKWHYIVITNDSECQKKYVDGELVHETIRHSS